MHDFEFLKLLVVTLVTKPDLILIDNFHGKLVFGVLVFREVNGTEGSTPKHSYRLICKDPLMNKALLAQNLIVPILKVFAVFEVYDYSLLRRIRVYELEIEVTGHSTCATFIGSCDKNLLYGAFAFLFLCVMLCIMVSLLGYALESIKFET